MIASQFNSYTFILFQESLMILQKMMISIRNQKNMIQKNIKLFHKYLIKFKIRFTKKFKWGFTAANSSLNGVLEIEANECKRYQQFLETFKAEEAEKS